MQFLLVLRPDEKESESGYIHGFAQYFKGHRCKIYTGEVITSTQVYQLASKANVDAIITTRVDLLSQLLPFGRLTEAKSKNYAGSLFKSEGRPDILIVPPLKQLYTVRHGRWLMGRFISKLTDPGKWRKTSEFKWKLAETATEFKEAYDAVASSRLVALDIETVQADLPVITSISYTALLSDMSTMTYVMELNCWESVQWMRKINDTATPKVMQNGKYDAAYCFAWGAPIVGYMHDTINALHCWYSELPKDLAFINSIFVRDAMYWKDLAHAGSKIDRLKYNALDTWATLESYISWVLEAPKWAKNNLIMKFPQVYISHYMEMIGLDRDLDRLKIRSKEMQDKVDKALREVKARTGSPNFNPGSSQQTFKLLQALGMSQLKNADEKAIKKAMLAHPLNEYVLQSILDYRAAQKLLSTYFSKKEFRDTKLLYSINPHGTDSGRDASKSHHFWCGLNIQNIPGHAWQVKDTIKFPEGYVGYEFDFSQAEARGVAYYSGDTHLLEAVESENDFHSYNCSAFFGVPYEQIYDNATHTKLNPELRDLSKRVNHGANYNMGAGVLLDTMGIPNVRKAQKLLNLDSAWTPLKVCDWLLVQYNTTYPRVKGVYYNWIKDCIARTKLLVGATGWTRYCFGDPKKSKVELNSYVSHPTQALNAVNLDEAARRVWLKFCWTPTYDVLLFAKIHDSLLMAIKSTLNHAQIADEIAATMTFPVPVTDCTGTTRDMIVPVDKKYLGRRWSGRD